MSKNLLPDNLILQSEAAVLVGGIIEDIMRETNMEKIQNTTHGSGCFEHCTPPVRQA